MRPGRHVTGHAADDRGLFFRGLFFQGSAFHQERIEMLVFFVPVDPQDGGHRPGLPSRYQGV
jgi:hypothetical protein